MFKTPIPEFSPISDAASGVMFFVASKGKTKIKSTKTKRLHDRWYAKESLGIMGTNRKPYNEFGQKGKEKGIREIKLEIMRGLGE